MIQKGTIFLPKRYWMIIILYIAAQIFPAIGTGLAMSWFGLSEGDAFVYSYIFGMTVVSFITIGLLAPDMEQSQFRSRPGITYTIKWAVLGFFLAFLAQYIANIIKIVVVAVPFAFKMKGIQENEN